MSPQPARRSSSHSLAAEPWLVVSAATALKYSARGVTGVSAQRIPDQARVRPSLYSGEQVLVRGAVAGSQAFGLLQQVAAEHSLVAEIDDDDLQIANQVAGLGLPELPPSEIVTRVRLRPAPGPPSAPPEPWLVMQDYRTQLKGGDDFHSVALDHLVALHEHVNGSPFIAGLEHVNGSPVVSGLEHVNGSPVTAAGSALAQYGRPGYGGRTPTAWVGRAPHRLADRDLTSRRPVVAVFDTGTGEHPWLTADIVHRDLELPYRRHEPDDAHEGPQLGDLDEDSGHGTFIAGLIRQTCPDANVLAVRIMDTHGVVAESDLVNALYLLLIRQVTAFRDRDPGRLVDVLTLSLGYYHEQPGDGQLDPMLLAPITALGRHGVVVVASAGNDATQRPVYPAAFTPHAGGLVPKPDHDVLPVISVGALNPDGTIALFSNIGAWVRAYRTGASVVSTMPTNLDGGVAATVITHGPGGHHRETIDPDDFKSGFGVWSGTSFAGPVLAGEIAQQLIDDQHLEPRRLTKASEFTPGRAVTRGWNAVSKALADDVHPIARPRRSAARHR